VRPKILANIAAGAVLRVWKHCIVFHAGRRCCCCCCCCCWRYSRCGSVHHPQHTRAHWRLVHAGDSAGTTLTHLSQYLCRVASAAAMTSSWRDVIYKHLSSLVLLIAGLCVVGMYDYCISSWRTLNASHTVLIRRIHIWHNLIQWQRILIQMRVHYRSPAKH